VPHVPQLLPSDSVFTQCPSQLTSPSWQLHTPARHACPTLQAELHDPQWLASVWVFTQAAPHCSRPTGQPETVLPSAEGWLPPVAAADRGCDESPQPTRSRATAWATHRVHCETCAFMRLPSSHLSSFAGSEGQTKALVNGRARSETWSEIP
jgi:hypothetical protein